MDTVYQIRFVSGAKKHLKKHSKNKVLLEKIQDAIKALAKDPWPPGCVKVKGVKEPCWRIVVGDFRIIYKVEEKEICVLIMSIGDRKEVYRNLQVILRKRQ